MEFIHQPSKSNRLGDYLKGNLSKPWTHFRAAVAFVKRSGTRHIAPALANFAQVGQIEIIAGVDHQGTSAEGLRDLLGAVSPTGRVIVLHNRLPITFHPKVYLFKSASAADVIIGSGNLTQGGLFTNYEAALRLSLDLGVPNQIAILHAIEQVLDNWKDPSNGIALPLDDELLTRLTSLGVTPLEAAAIHEAAETERDDDKTLPVPADFPFAIRAEPGAPAIPRPFAVRDALPAETGHPTQVSVVFPIPSQIAGLARFVMTLQRTDVGVGQMTTGTSRRSPEIFIPLVARNANPGFWGWPHAFMEDPQKAGKFDRRGVQMRFAGEIVTVNMMTWPDKHDFRLRSESLRSSGNIGDILFMEKVDPGTGYEYDVKIIPQGTTDHPKYMTQCHRPVSNSRKRFGYY